MYVIFVAKCLPILYCKRLLIQSCIRLVEMQTPLQMSDCCEDRAKVSMKAMFLQVWRCTTTPEPDKSSRVWLAFLGILRAVLLECFFYVLQTLTWPPPFLLCSCQYFITLQTEEMDTWKSFAIFFCFVISFSVLGCCYQELMAAHCWDKVWGFRVFLKLWDLHQVALPNNDSVLILRSEKQKYSMLILMFQL